MEKFKAFIDAINTDPRAKELLKALPVPGSDEEAYDGYLKVAKELGLDLSREEIQAGMKSMEASRKAATDKISLEDGDLDRVAGGGDGDTHPDLCDSTLTEGEWCWFSDSCSVIITDYSDTLYMRKLVDDAQKDIDELEEYANKLSEDKDIF